MNTTILLLTLSFALTAIPLSARSDSTSATDTTYTTEVQITETLPKSEESSNDIPPGTDEPEDITPVEKPRRCESCKQRRNKDILVVRETADTVFILNKRSFRAFTRDWKNNFDRMRQKSIGLSGTSSYGINAVAMHPIEDFIDNHPGFKGKRFHDISRFGFEPYIMSGGSFVIGLGEGFRLGGSGMTGERRFFSDPFNDSILVLNTRVGYGGFLIEKATVNGRWNFTYGGSIGAGAIKVVLTEKNSSDLFSVTDDYSTGFYDDDDLFKDKGYQSSFFMLEPHCGFSYTFFTFFHVGGSVSLPVFMSMEDILPYTDDFISVNPGLQLKLIFGNLG